MQLSIMPESLGASDARIRRSDYESVPSTSTENDAHYEAIDSAHEPASSTESTRIVLRNSSRSSSRRRKLFNTTAWASICVAVAMGLIILATQIGFDVDPAYNFGVYPFSKIVTDRLCTELKALAGNASAITPDNLDKFLSELESDQIARNQLTAVMGLAIALSVASVGVSFFWALVTYRILRGSCGMSTRLLLHPCIYLIVFLPVLLDWMAILLLVLEIVLYPCECVVLLPQLFPAIQLSSISFMYGAAVVWLMTASLYHIFTGRLLIDFFDVLSP